MTNRVAKVFVRKRWSLLAARWALSSSSALLVMTAPVLASVASAQPAQQAQPSPEEYQQLVQQGLHEYELGNFVEAKAFFLRAHQLSPSARTLRGLGMVSYELRRYVEAIQLFKQALASQERPLTAAMQQEVSQLLSQALTFVTWLDLSVSPQQARVRVDTREATRDADGRIMLDPGAHELTVEAPGYTTLTRSVRGDGADTLSLNVRLLDKNRSLSLDVAGSTNAARAAPSSSVGPYVLMGSSAALAVAGGVLLAVALEHKHAVENPVLGAQDGPRYADVQSKADSVLPLSAAGIGALCAGGAGIVAGLIWKLTSSGSAPVEKTPQTRLTLTGTGIALESHFR